MSPQEKSMFARLATEPAFAEWLKARQADAVRVLASHRDMPVLHQHQGRYALIQEILDAIASCR